MTDCQGDGEGTNSPMEVYEKLTAQGEEVRALKTAKAEKVCACYLLLENVHLTLVIKRVG